MTSTSMEHERNRTANPPLTPGPLGTHPVGTGLGAVAGGVAGNKIARAIDPAAEEAFWRENYSSRPYVNRGKSLTSIVPPIATASMPMHGAKGVRSSRRNLS